MTTEIGQLNLRLPAGFEARAQRIGRLVGESLARQDGLPGGQVGQIGVGPVRVDARASDRAIAESIAQSIHAALGRCSAGVSPARRSDQKNGAGETPALHGA